MKWWRKLWNKLNGYKFNFNFTFTFSFNKNKKQTQLYNYQYRVMEKQIRKMEMLTMDELLLLKKLSKEELIHLIYIYNNSIETLSIDKDTMFWL
jgi:hypothetical protein